MWNAQGGVCGRAQGTAGSHLVRLLAGELTVVLVRAERRVEAVGRPEEVQAAQEGSESVLTLRDSVRAVTAVLAEEQLVQEAQEAQEVQDHPSRLPPDRAALAHQGRSPEGGQCRPRHQTHQGCPPHPAASQRR